MSATAAGRVVFVDTETTGLQPWYHEVWEIAVIERRLIHHETTVTGPARDQTVDTEHVFHIKPDLTKADSAALRINRFYERTRWFEEWRDPHDTPAVPGQHWDIPTHAARQLAQLLDGAHIVGAVPSFDAAFLGRFLHRFGQCPTWHYHLIDINALAVGYFASSGCAPALPWRSDDLAADLGVKTDPASRHTALGDARWARDVYDAVMTGARKPNPHLAAAASL